MILYDLNSGNTKTNTNLLVNSNFMHPVNSGGQTTYNGTFEETIDKWTCNGGYVTAIDLGVALGKGGWYSQRMSYAREEFLGKTMTFSLELNDGTILKGTAQVPSTFTENMEVHLLMEKDYKYGVYLQHWTNDNEWRFIINLINLGDLGQQEWIIKWIKLEYGNKATPYVALPYEQEEMMCKGIDFTVEKSEKKSVDFSSTTQTLVFENFDINKTAFIVDVYNVYVSGMSQHYTFDPSGITLSFNKSGNNINVNIVTPTQNDKILYITAMQFKKAKSVSTTLEQYSLSSSSTKTIQATNNKLIVNSVLLKADGWGSTSYNIKVNDNFDLTNHSRTISAMTDNYKRLDGIVLSNIITF